MPGYFIHEELHAIVGNLRTQANYPERLLTKLKAVSPCTKALFRKMHSEILVQRLLFWVPGFRYIYPYLFTNMDKKSMNRKRSQHLLWTWCESVVPDHVPRDLCSVIALCVSRIADSVRPGGRRAGRERNIDPYTTSDTSLSSIQRGYTVINFSIYLEQVFQLFLLFAT